MTEYEVYTKKLPAMKIVSLRDTVPDYAQITRLFEEFCPYLERVGAHYAGPAMALYHDMEYRESDVDIEVAVPVHDDIPVTDRIGMRVMPEVETAACVLHRGSYEELHKAYMSLLAWVEQNGYQVDGPDREIYLVGPGDSQADTPMSYVTELQIPVKKA